MTSLEAVRTEFEDFHKSLHGEDRNLSANTLEKLVRSALTHYSYGDIKGREDDLTQGVIFKLLEEYAKELGFAPGGAPNGQCCLCPNGTFQFGYILLRLIDNLCRQKAFNPDGIPMSQLGDEANQVWNQTSDTISASSAECRDLYIAVLRDMHPRYRLIIRAMVADFRELETKTDESSGHNARILRVMRALGYDPGDEADRKSFYHTKQRAIRDFKWRWKERQASSDHS